MAGWHFSISRNLAVFLMGPAIYFDMKAWHVLMCLVIMLKINVERIAC